MKTTQLLQADSNVESVYPAANYNVQEAQTFHPVSIAKADGAESPARPRILSQRVARQNRRFAH